MRESSSSVLRLPLSKKWTSGNMASSIYYKFVAILTRFLAILCTRRVNVWRSLQKSKRTDPLNDIRDWRLVFFFVQNCTTICFWIVFSFESVFFLIIMCARNKMKKTTFMHKKLSWNITSIRIIIQLLIYDLNTLRNIDIKFYEKTQNFR